MAPSQLPSRGLPGAKWGQCLGLLDSSFEMTLPLTLCPHPSTLPDSAFLIWNSSVCITVLDLSCHLLLWMRIRAGAGASAGAGVSCLLCDAWGAGSMCKAQYLFLSEWMNEKEVRMEEEGGGSVGSSERLSREEGSRLQVGWEQGPTQLSIKCTWVPWTGRK